MWSVSMAALALLRLKMEFSWQNKTLPSQSILCIQHMSTTIFKLQTQF